MNKMEESTEIRGISRQTDSGHVFTTTLGVTIGVLAGIFLAALEA